MAKMRKLDKILEDRGASYGSFRDNLKAIHFYKKQIKVNTTLSSDNPEIESSVEFIKNMLALKAARSINAVGIAKEDCINDFINYMRLFLDEYNATIELNKDIFNPNLVVYGKTRDLKVLKNADIIIIGG